LTWRIPHISILLDGVPTKEGTAEVTVQNPQDKISSRLSVMKTETLRIHTIGGRLELCWSGQGFSSQLRYGVEIALEV